MIDHGKDFAAGGRQVEDVVRLPWGLDDGSEDHTRLVVLGCQLLHRGLLPASAGLQPAISEGGARLEVATAVGAPNAFTHAFDDGRAVTLCGPIRIGISGSEGARSVMASDLVDLEAHPIERLRTQDFTNKAVRELELAL